MYILASSWEILFLICGLGILQGVLLALLILFHRRSDRSVNLFLALYIFCTSAIITIPFVIKAMGWENGYWIPPFPVLSGPLLYLYLRSFKERITWRKALPHLLLFFIFYFVSYWNITRLSALYSSSEGIPAEALRNPITIIIFIARPVQQIIYYFLSRRVLLSYQRSIRHLFSETSRIDLQWTKFLLNGYLILVLAFLIIYPLILRFPEHVYLLLAINMTIAVPYIYMVTGKGIMQPSIWQLLPGADKESVEKEIIRAEEIDTTEEKLPATEKSVLSAEKLSRSPETSFSLWKKKSFIRKRN